MTATQMINTSKYEFSHGRKPRGEGYWGFYFVDHKSDTTRVEFAPGFIKYTEARRWAVERANATDSTVISVAT